MSYTAWSVVAGETPTAAKWNILGSNDSSFNDGTGIAAGAIGTSLLADSGVTPAKLLTGTGSSWAYQSWTPTWTGTTVGNATVVAKYIQIGKTVHFHIVFTVGSTTSLAVGVDTIFSLPVTAASSGYGQYVSVLGRGGGLHGGTLQFNSTLYNNTTTAIVAAEKVVSATAVSAAWNTTNVGISTGDVWGMSGIYDAA